MSFKNWPIIWKIVSLLSLLGIISLVGAGYAAIQMRAIDTTYTNMIQGPSMALLEGARANRAISAIGEALFQHIVSTTDADNQAAAALESADLKTFDDKVADVGRLFPEFGERFNQAKRVLHKAYDESCAETRKWADSTDTEGIAKASSAMLKTCKPALDELTKSLVGISADMVDRMHTIAAAASGEAFSTVLTMLSSIIAGTIGIIALAIFVVRGGITNPIRELMTMMQALGAGNYGQSVKNRDRHDEVGAMAQSLDTLRLQLAAAEETRQEKVRADEIARQRLVEREQLANGFIAQMQTLATGFAASSDEVAGAARNLASTAEETSRQAQSVASAAEEASQNVQTVAASSEELSASIREITGQVAQSAKVADGAYAEAESSNVRIGELASAAAAIGDVINLIKGIADQTNLLALNATIEAARAGDAGRGFAVVASEVKQLATQTSKATDEIGSKISEIQAATNGTVHSMKEIARTIGNVKQIATAIAGAVEEQGAATGEIAANCTRAAQGAAQVTKNITTVGRTAEMTGAASTQLMSVSSGLSNQAADLRRAVEDFVKKLNAA